MTRTFPLARASSLPSQYQILPLSVDFRIPDFLHYYTAGDKTLALRNRDCCEWFHSFVDRVVSACGERFLPVCRMSDGEYLFALGEQPLDLRLPWSKRTMLYLRRRLGSLRRPGYFNATTIGHYRSGRYSRQEWRTARVEYATLARRLSQVGILALHLSYGLRPFQERFFPALGRWLHAHQIDLTDENYVPFYFVYAALTGPRRREILHGRRVLVVNSAEGNKREQIVAGLFREGVAEVHWLPISAERSLYDRVDVSPWQGKVELALVGAGIGKVNILCQMAPLNVPCVDAGFVFEVWADPANKWKRAACAPDSDWEDAQPDR